ncbi:MAG: ABC transporter permease [Actinomycetota bacterium]
MALASITPSSEAGPPLANLLVLPLYFVSGVFVPVASLPDWLSSAASVFPIAPFVKIISDVTPWPAIRSQAGAGVPRTRLKRPVSRRLTIVIASDTKQAETMPIAMKAGTCRVDWVRA